MRLAVLGDSLTYGYPFGPQISWLQVLGKRLGLAAYNHGVCGETTADMLLRINTVLKEDNITHFLLFGGANDILLANRPLDYILSDILRIQELALAHALKTGCILPFVPDVDFYREKFIALRELITVKSRCCVKIIDLQPALLADGDKVNYFCDGVHFTIEANNKIGEYAAAALAEWFKRKE